MRFRLLPRRMILGLALAAATRAARADDQAAGSARTRQPAWLDPELATLTADRFSDPAWIFERKFDGERCLAFRDGQQLRLMTRNRQRVTGTYPEIAGALRAQEATDFIIDGEVVAFDGDQTSFSRLQRRLGVSDPGPALLAEVPVYIYLFDVLWADGRDVRPRPLLERKALLRDLLSFGDPLRFTEHRDRDGQAYYAEACRLGWEGIIAKRADAPYRPGRNRDWLKFKCLNGQEFVIGGYTDPKGSRVGFGALLLGCYGRDGRLHYAGKVGTGFDRHTLTSLHAALAADQRPDPPFEPVRALPRSGVHWVQPRLVAQIGFSEWTADGELRQPRFQGLRRDKDPADVVRETPLRDQRLRHVLDGNHGERPSQPAAQLLGLGAFPDLRPARAQSVQIGQAQLVQRDQLGFELWRHKCPQPDRALRRPRSSSLAGPAPTRYVIAPRDQAARAAPPRTARARPRRATSHRSLPQVVPRPGRLGGRNSLTWILAAAAAGHIPRMVSCPCRFRRRVPP
jgi:bifunctional non-homologous end joining protein LigD